MLWDQFSIFFSFFLMAEGNFTAAGGEESPLFFSAKCNKKLCTTKLILTEFT